MRGARREMVNLRIWSSGRKVPYLDRSFKKVKKIEKYVGDHLRAM